MLLVMIVLALAVSIALAGSAGGITDPGTPDPDPIDGTDEADDLQGTGGDDVMRGLSGDDTIQGFGGDDTIDGGGGDDYIRGGEGEPRGLLQKGGGLCGREAQVGGAHVDHLAAGAQAGEGQSWVLACGDDEVHVGWEVVEQKGDGIIHGRRVDDVVVVEHQHERIGL